MSATHVEPGELGGRRKVERRQADSSLPPTDSVCRVAILTPPGRGAVASVAVAGPQATSCVDLFFRTVTGRPLGEFPCGRILFGRWQGAGPAGEEVVVCRRTPQEVEIHCHGGRLAARTIVDSLVGRGAREISWQDWATRQTAGRIEAEARIALAAARTERTAAILLDQWRGALRSSLAQAVAHLRRGEPAAAALILQTLQQRADVGLHLAAAWRVVLTGRPNVGKSSLINAVLGFERCIVHAEPGTTRDVITAQTALEGWPVELADTAGVRDGTDEIEVAGVRRARQQLEQADLVVLVFDTSSPWTKADDAAVAEWPDALVTHNKCDLAPGLPQARPPGLTVSAATGTGIDTLSHEIARRLVPQPPAPDAAVAFTHAQIQVVQAAQTGLAASHNDEALSMLTRLLAE
ncbi:MAG: GTP-binding protein [Candidatus Anammoximicrobium sp.]|nr:GTP-binding protein [Candidatus Anammoximicrobium sp.]